MALEIDVSYQDYKPPKGLEATLSELKFREEKSPREYVVAQIELLLARCGVSNGRFTAFCRSYYKLAGTKSLSVEMYRDERKAVDLRYRPESNAELISVTLVVEDCVLSVAQLFARLSEVALELNAKARELYKAERDAKQSPSAESRRELLGALKKKRTRQRKIRELRKEIKEINSTIAMLKKRIRDSG